MFVQPIQNTKTQSPAFKSVRIAKNIYPVDNNMLISVVADGKKGLVQFIDINNVIETILGHSRDAEMLEDLLATNGKSITKKKKTVAIVRDLMQSVVERFMPELKQEIKSTDGKRSTTLTKELLDSLDDAINNGKPEYYEHKNEFQPEALCLRGKSIKPTAQPIAVSDNRIVPNNDYIEEIDPLKIALENNGL